ncbi:MAG: GNAT family protein [Solirubrobacterales bacterium]
MNPPLTTPLAGALVSLEPLAPEHREDLWRALDHDEVWTWIPIGRPDEEGFERFFNYLLAENVAGRMGTWVVRANESGAIIGTSSYLAIRLPDRGLEIGMTMYSPAAWRTGANRATKLLMLEHGFETLGLQRIEFKTDARNERSRAALLALSATFEGIFRKHMDTAQGVRDSAYYSVIDDEWPALKAKLLADLER